jgi:hypothetical protein
MVTLKSRSKNMLSNNDYFILCCGLNNPQFLTTLMNRHFKPLMPQFAWIIFKNSVRTAKKTQHFSIEMVNAVNVLGKQSLFTLRITWNSQKQNSDILLAFFHSVCVYRVFKKGLTSLKTSKIAASKDRSSFVFRWGGGGGSNLFCWFQQTKLFPICPQAFLKSR